MKRFEKLFVKLVPILFMIIFIILPNFVLAWDIQGEIGGLEGGGGEIVSKAQNIMGTAKRTVVIVGEAMVTISLIMVGIKYMSAAPEGRAEYKKMALPLIAGATIVFNVDRLIGVIQSQSYDSEAESIMSVAKNTASVVGGAMVTIMLLILGIKYMLSAPEGKAEFRKTATPYIVGATIVLLPGTVVNVIRNRSYAQFAGGYMSDTLATVQTISSYVPLIILLILGIKYMVSAPEGKAEFKKTAIPYLVGAVIVYSANTIIGMIQSRNYTAQAGDTMSVIINVLRYIGVGMAVVMLLILAIKYMMSSPEGKAEFQKTAIPYIVGAIVLFASSSILEIIQNIAYAL